MRVLCKSSMHSEPQNHLSSSSLGLLLASLAVLVLCCVPCPGSWEPDRLSSQCLAYVVSRLVLTLGEAAVCLLSSSMLAVGFLQTPFIILRKLPSILYLAEGSYQEWMLEFCQYFLCDYWDNQVSSYGKWYGILSCKILTVIILSVALPAACRCCEDRALSITSTRSPPVPSTYQHIQLYEWLT
jgi:hypothetical protein